MVVSGMPGYMNPYGNQMAVTMPPSYQERMMMQSYNQGMQNPYPQPAQNNQIPYGLNGRCVMSADNITFQDVPTDSTYAFFPRQDMQEIYARALNGDGSVDKRVYRLVPNEEIEVKKEEVKVNLSDEFTEVLMKRFDNIDSRLEKVEKTMGSVTKSTNNKTNKEV